MAIIIKEIHVRTTVTPARQNVLTEERVRKLKQEIIVETLKKQEIRNRWSKER